MVMLADDIRNADHVVDSVAVGTSLLVAASICVKVDQVLQQVLSSSPGIHTKLEPKHQVRPFTLLQQFLE